MMKHVYLSLVALLVGPSVVRSAPDFVKEGSCPIVNEAVLWQQQQPNHWQMDGNWYQHSRTPNPFDPFSRCVQWRLEYIGGAFRTTSTGVDAAGAPIRTLGSLFYDPQGPRLLVTHEGAPPGPLVVLATDYQNYACFYACKDVQRRFYGDFGFIFSRTPKMDPRHVKVCQEAFAKIGVDSSTFEQTPQGDNCPYEETQAI
ncbi:crustacyanin-C1 subunit-like [Palaemon carinicauda]|uniref:crustacyanin-C1 subunit-like n=1 Tax=Palaemon carinicauda TaxID=392227 RepID=UPI0035B6394B